MSDKKQDLEVLTTKLIPTVRLCIQREGRLHCIEYNGKMICRLPLPENQENPEKICPYQGSRVPFPKIINRETGKVELYVQRFTCEYNKKEEMDITSLSLKPENLF